MKRYVFSVIASLVCYNMLYSVFNTINCPQTLNPWDESVAHHEVNTGISTHERSEAVTNSYFSGTAFLNGRPVKLEGIHYIQPAVPVEQVKKHATESKLSGYSFYDGVLTCIYDVGMGKDEKYTEVAIDSKAAGTLYQCLLPQQVLVVDQQETGLALLQAVPRCSKQTMTTKECEKYALEVHVDRSMLVKSATQPDHFYIRSHLGEFYKDETDQKNRPMDFKMLKVKDEDAVHTYKFVGKFGPLRIESASVQRDLIAQEGQAVTDPAKVHGANRGSGVDEHGRAIDHKGELVLPPCRATKILVDQEGRAKVQCVYGKDAHSFNSIVLEGDLTHEVNLAKCHFSGGSLGAQQRNVAQMLKTHNPLSISSLKRTHEFSAPPVMICTP